ncbi:MAG: hypothetical protein ABIO24_10395 [Saprospiraceae bacterium]
MAQLGWVLLDSHGGRHKVGLYHGDNTGHLMIHCNLRVVQVDFSVRESRTYSFFIEDELCELSLQKEPDGRFSYAFEMNKTVDTPRNRDRKADQERTNRQVWMFVGGFVLLLAIAVGSLTWFGRQQRRKELTSTSLFSKVSEENAQRLSLEGKVTSAQLYLVFEGLQRKVFYGFTTADSARISGKFSVADTGIILLPNGFPLHDHDAFELRYLPADPEVHRLDFFHPTRSTMAGYLQQAAAEEGRNHPEQSLKRNQCLAMLVAERLGWDKLADLIFQNQSPDQNERHNHDSYLRLMRNPGLVKMLQDECWDK